MGGLPGPDHKRCLAVTRNRTKIRAKKAKNLSTIKGYTMARMNVQDVKQGDMLAIPERSSISSVSYKLLIVQKVTATQACCVSDQGGAGEWRIRKSDGKVIGEDHLYAQVATPDLIETVKEQRALKARRDAANAMLRDLEGKNLHQLKLNLVQLESLAMAWTAVKAMGG